MQSVNKWNTGVQILCLRKILILNGRCSTTVFANRIQFAELGRMLYTEVTSHLTPNQPWSSLVNIGGHIKERKLLATGFKRPVNRTGARQGGLYQGDAQLIKPEQKSPTLLFTRSYRKRVRSLLLCPLSVERCYFPSFVDSLLMTMHHLVFEKNVWGGGGNEVECAGKVEIRWTQFQASLGQSTQRCILPPSVVVSYRSRWDSMCPECQKTLLRLCIIIIIIYSLTARVVGAPQMVSQPVSSIFPVLHCSLGLGELQTCPFPDVVSLQDGFDQTWWTGNMTIPLQFASLYDGQVFVWSNCLLDLDTDFLVGLCMRCVVILRKHLISVACILLWSSAVSAHDSQACRKMDVTRERICRILELRKILLSIQTCFSLVNAAVVWTILAWNPQQL